MVSIGIEFDMKEGAIRSAVMLIRFGNLGTGNGNGLGTHTM